jgi:Ca2+-binding EF-hand superfamily protein
MFKHIVLGGAIGLGLTSSALAGDEPDKKRILPGPITSVTDIQETAKLLFKAADTNNDGQISQKEAVDAGNLLVGGFFFRADANGDGVVSADEAKQAQETLFAQQPLLKLIVERIKAPDTSQSGQGQPTTVQATPGGANDRGQTVRNLTVDPMKTIGDLLDTNHNQKIESSEVRQAVQTVVQALFITADANQDGQLSPYEINEAADDIFHSAAESAFQAADLDRNNALSVDEYDKALVGPAHAVFRVIDANGDNQVTLDELKRAEQILIDQIGRLRVPEPANSPVRRLSEGPSANANQPAAVNPPAAVQPAVPATTAPVAPRTQP